MGLDTNKSQNIEFKQTTINNRIKQTCYRKEVKVKKSSKKPSVCVPEILTYLVYRSEKELVASQVKGERERGFQISHRL